MAGSYLKKTVVEAAAKVNFSINVLGTDGRGYHYLDMIMQSVPLSDVITVSSVIKRVTIPKKIVVPEKLPVSISCDVKGVPTDGRNIAFRAAELLIKRFPRMLVQSDRIEIDIKKRIPVGGGLGGSSADGAGTLVALNNHFELGLSEDELAAAGAEIGSDVPFMVKGGTARVRGFGEIVETLPSPPEMQMLICCPPYGVDTWEVYRKYDVINVPDDARPDNEMLASALANGSFDELVSGMKNVLEVPAFAVKKSLVELKTRLEGIGSEKVLLSGSGSSFFCVFRREAEARIAANRLVTEGFRVYVLKIGDRK